MSPDATTFLGISIGIRSIMEPQLPLGYYGCAFVHAFVTSTTRELSESSLSHVVRLIEDMKKAALDKRYVLGKLSEAERRVPMRMQFICVLLPASKADPAMSGGVRLLVTLPNDSMTKFKEEMNAI